MAGQQKAKREESKDGLTVLTVTLKGVAAAAADAASMAGGVLSVGLPGTLRRRPDLSGGDSAKKKKNGGIERRDVNWARPTEESRPASGCAACRLPLRKQWKHATQQIDSPATPGRLY